MSKTRFFLLCCLLPLSLFFVLYAINSSFIFNFIGFVDGYAYLGHSYDRIGLRNAMPYHPSGDLLPFLMTSSAFYHFFDPLTANFLWKFFSFLGPLLIFSWLCATEFNVLTAVLSTICLAFYKYYLMATGFDYTDGRIVLLLFFTLYCLVKANRSSHILRANAFWLILAGLTYSFSVSTALLTLIYFPGLLLFFLIHRGYLEGKDFFASSLYVFVGFLIGVGILCTLHHSYTQDWIYFRPTIEKARSFLGSVRGYPEMPWEGNWLKVSFAVVAVFLYRFFKGERPSRKQVAYFVAMAWGFLALTYLQMAKHQRTIGDFYYYNQTMPFVFMAFAGIVIYPLTQFEQNRWTVLLPLLFLTVGAIQYLLTTRFINFHQTFQFWELIPLLLLGRFPLSRMHLSSSKPAALILLLVLFSFANISAEMFNHLYVHYNEWGKIKSRKANFLYTLQWVDYVKKIDPKREAYLWYSRGDGRDYLVSWSSASHLWQGKLVNEHFPIIQHTDGEVGYPIEQLEGRRIIVLSHSENALLQAAENVANLKHRLDCKEIGRTEVSSEEKLDIMECFFRRLVL